MKSLSWMILLLSISRGVLAGAGLSDVPLLPYEIVDRQASDASVFTQGLVIVDGMLLQSGGNYGESRLVRRPLGSAAGTMTRRLPAAWFAEGIAVFEGSLFMLTWREGLAVRYTLPDLVESERFTYSGPGWGLTSDGRQLLMSDGSNELTWRDPASFAVTRRLPVLAGTEPVNSLNELEWVEGRVLANVWQTDWVLVIDPENGQVLGKLDLSGLLSPRERRRANVLNGVAWDSTSRLLYVTGKCWPWLFALRLDGDLP